MKMSKFACPYHPYVKVETEVDQATGKIRVRCPKCGDLGLVEP
jgi:hypothetical protein